MATSDILQLGRSAFREENWNEAYVYLSKFDKEYSLAPQDLELLAVSAFLTGNFDACYDKWAQAHTIFLKKDIPKAVHCAFWLGLCLINKGEYARGGGWIGRAGKLLEESGQDCAEKGFLLIPVALRLLGQGDATASLQAFTKALEIGKRYGDPDLLALARLGTGQAHIRMDQPEKGVILLDEAMIAVESGELSPITVGIIYCAVIEACMEIFDLNRAQEWTDALSDWCSSHPHLVPFQGQCLTRRSEIMMLHGEWTKALKEVNHAIDLLSKPKGEPAVGAAFYQLGDLYRLLGKYKEAEAAYNEANKFGKKPQPGLAMVRLAQGQLEKAKSSIRLALQETKNLGQRSATLFACLEIMLADGKTEEARVASEELSEMATGSEAPLLKALAYQASGTLLLAEDDFQPAVDHLQNAWKKWQELKAPYQVARTRFLIGIAYNEMGITEAAKLEYEAAKWVFHKLQARPDLDRLNRLYSKKAKNTGILTRRELQVLRLIADGKSNKSIADELFISDRTVERHVSNIFSKMGVSSRTAAMAYAYQNQLL